MTDASFTLPPEEAGRLWVQDPIHCPRALPPLASDIWVDMFTSVAMGMDSLVVNGFCYSSPKSMAPGAPPRTPAPGEARRNWETRYLPAIEAAYRTLRDAPLAGRSASEILQTFRELTPIAMEAFNGTILSVQELSPDADRLSDLLEKELGPDGALLAATILHGADSETASIGRDVAKLAEAARATAGIAEAILAHESEGPLASRQEPWAGALRAFLEDHADEVGLWSEIHEPPWSEDPRPLLRLVGATLRAPERQHADASAQALEEARARLRPEALPAFEEAVALGHDYVPIIEHRARLQLKLVGALRRLLVALGDRLAEAGATDSRDDVFLLHSRELEPAAAGELDARALVPARRAEWQRNLGLMPPRTLGMPVAWEMIGAISPMARRMFGAVRIAAPTATVVSGVGASRGIVTGRARVVRSLMEADDLSEGDILICPSTSPPWTPYFSVVAAVVTNSGGVLSHAAIEAREYGIPAVVGTHDATERIPDGTTVQVDGAAGTITLVQ